MHCVKNPIYKVIRKGDMGRQAELFLIPQTIAVPTKIQLDGAGRSDLKGILASKPNIERGELDRLHHFYHNLIRQNTQV